ncbi:hypothetical protein [Massilia sp. TS11]|uniref:hypothetical protein n=1 Tax=Massilia sp. TS11 TaxID=2908003 RepID=UPI001ED9DD8C|nr:hypothetical protein [Massilia sp. TS11]MCG2583894.1 hypothetical protein [Massilia sp. TS11]
MNAPHLVLAGPPKKSTLVGLALLFLACLAAAAPSFAVDLVTFAGITGPLTSALTQISALSPGIKALIGVLAFVVALITLAALRDFGPVLRYIGVAIFGATGLVVGGAIMGMTI